MSQSDKGFKNPATQRHDYPRREELFGERLKRQVGVIVGVIELGGGRRGGGVGVWPVGTVARDAVSDEGVAYKAHINWLHSHHR